MFIASSTSVICLCMLAGKFTPCATSLSERRARGYPSAAGNFQGNKPPPSASTFLVLQTSSCTEVAYACVFLCVEIGMCEMTAERHRLQEQLRSALEQQQKTSSSLQQHITGLQQERDTLQVYPHVHAQYVIFTLIVYE